MSSNDLDPHLIKCIGLLYESKKLRKGDPVPLQYILEEAIFQKTGIVKDYTDFFQSQLPPRESEEPAVGVASSIYDDKGNNSDNDLELDLFKDDLSCVICNKMDVGARNRLLECSDCHALYHQECHKPVVGEEDVTDTWICSNCKSISTAKKLKSSEKEHGSSKSSSSSKSESHRHSSSSSSHKSSSDKYKSSSSSSKSSSGGSKSSSGASPSHSSSRSDEKKSSSSSSSSSKSGKSSSSKYYGEKRKHE